MKKVGLLVVLLILALVASNAFATPTLTFDVDFYTNGANATDNYAKGGAYDTGQTILLRPSEIVWVDLYVSGLTEPGNGLIGYGFSTSWNNVELASNLPASAASVPIYPWVDFGLSGKGAGYLNVQAGHFPPGTGAEGNNILLATWQFTCTGAGLSPLVINNWPVGDPNWLTLLGEDLSGQVNNVALGTINNVPIPGAIWLLGSGLLGLLGFRRNRQ